MINKDLTDWTTAETLWLWRRGKILTQTQAAAALGVPAGRYQAAEAGRSNGGAVDCPEPSLGDLCALARRRRGLGLVGTARAARVSKITLISREMRGDP